LAASPEQRAILALGNRRASTPKGFAMWIGEPRKSVYEHMATLSGSTDEGRGPRSGAVLKKGRIGADQRRGGGKLNTKTGTGHSKPREMGADAQGRGNSAWAGNPSSGEGFPTEGPRAWKGLGQARPSSLCQTPWDVERFIKAVERLCREE